MENTKICNLESRNADKEKLILLPYNYIQQVPFTVNTSFLKIFNVWFKIPEEKLKQIDAVLEALTYVTVLWDDIEDNAVLRRGIPATHTIFGIPSTLSASTMACVILVEKCLALNHPDAIGEFTKVFKDYLRGEGIEIYWRDNYICPSEEEYNEMAIQKITGFFMMSIRLMQLFSENKRDFSKLVFTLGLYDHILDDYLNLTSETYNANSFCDDITEGKFSFPIIHAIHSSAEAKTSIMHILRQRTSDKKVLQTCVNLLENCGSFEYTRKRLESLKSEIKEEVAKLGLDEFLEKFLSLIPDMATQEEIVDTIPNTRKTP